MTRVVEVSAEAVAGVRGDVAAVREAVDADWASLRARALALGVPTSGFDDVLGAGDRLGTHVLPVVETHLDRARALEDLRYGGALGRPLPVLDVDPAPVALPFGTAPFDDGGTTLTWAATSPGDIAADEQAAADSREIGDWFSDRWDDVSGAVADGADWVADTAGRAWQTVTEAGAAIGDWWETTTADLGSWIDENLANVRELVGRHVAVFRFLADALQIVGWVLVAVGAVLTVVLGVVGALGGFAAGTLLGGVAGVPGGVAGAAAGATFGLKILGVGFTLVSVGDFLDVVADWGEGTIDGQDLVRLGTLELGLAATSLLGVGVVGKILQKAVKHLPASWRSRIDDLLGRLRPRTGPLDEQGMKAPLRSERPSGDGWRRVPDTNPDPHYGLPLSASGSTFNRWNDVPPAVTPGIADLGGTLDDLWGVDPATGRSFTEAEWKKRFLTPRGGPHWPPNDGAVPGSRILFEDADSFLQTYGDQFDRIGRPDGDYLGVPPGTPFEQRSLPPGHLGRDLHSYTLSGRLPDGLTIEVSEIAPAFGRPGGGIQVRFMEGDRPVTIEELLPAAPGADAPFAGTLQ